MLNGGLERVREALQFIKPAERNAAHYILEHPDEVILLSIKELAKRSNSSQAAIIRLCKSLGLVGFQELKLRIAGDLQLASHGEEEYTEIKPNENLPNLIRNISNNAIYSIRQTLKFIDTKAVEQAVQALYQAQRIDFYGVAASQIIAQDAQQKFLRINKMCTAYPDSHLQLTSAVNLTKSDVAFGISYSGETEQVLAAIKQAKDSGATTIGLTRYGSNRLSELVDIKLSIFSTEADIRSAATSSRITQLNLIDILFTAVASQNYEQTVAYLRKTRSILHQKFRHEQTTKLAKHE